MRLSSDLFKDKRNESSDMLSQIQSIELRILKYVDHICKENNINYWLDGGTLLGAVRHGGFIPWDDDIDIVMPRADFVKFISIAKRILPSEFKVHTNNDEDYDNFFVSAKIYDLLSEVTEGNIQDKNKGIFIDINIIDYYSENYFINYFQLKIMKPFFRILCRNSFKLEYNVKISKTYKIFSFVINLFALLFGRKYVVQLFVSFFSILFSKSLIKIKSNLCGYGYDVYWTRVFKSTDIFPLNKMKFCDAYFNVPSNSCDILKVFYGESYMTLPPESERFPHHIQSVVVDKKSFIE